MKTRPVRHFVYAWIALLALLAITAGSAFIPMGLANGLVNYAVAFAKTAIVMILFMHALASGGFVRILAITGLAWLVVMGSLGLTDYATRGPANASRPEMIRYR